MLTRCPRCKTSFRVLAEHLKLAHGRVQCGRCYIQFDALENLYDEESDAVPRLDAASSPAPETSAVTVADDFTGNAANFEAVEPPPPEDAGDLTEAPAEFEAPMPAATPEIADATEVPLDAGSDTDESEIFSVRLDADETAEQDLEETNGHEIPIGDMDAFDSTEVEAEVAVPAPRGSAKRRDVEIDDDDVLLQDFNEPVIAREHVDDELIAAQAHPVENRRSHPLWGIIAALLLLLGAGQFVWYQRENLVERFPPLRPVIEAACARLGCTLQPRRDLEAIKVLARDVRDHPRFKNSLLVNATIENEAPFTQPYPTLELTLYDDAGKPIGVRRFQPEEYLDSSVPVKLGMKPRQPVYIVLEIARPAVEAVSFEFKFY